MERKPVEPEIAVQSTTKYPCDGTRLRVLVGRPESMNEYILLFRRFLGTNTALDDPNKLEQAVARELAEKDARNSPEAGFTALEPHPSDINPEWEPPTIDLTGAAVVVVSV